MPHTLLLVPRIHKGVNLTDDLLDTLMAEFRAKGVLEVTVPSDHTKHLVPILDVTLTSQGIEAVVGMTYDPDTESMMFDGSGPMDFLFEEEAPGPLPSPRLSARDWAIKALTTTAGALKSLPKPIAVGSRVRTKTMPNPPTDWTPEITRTRKFGIAGVVVSVHNSHGLCFGVQHDDNGFVSYYDPQELEAIP